MEIIGTNPFSRSSKQPLRRENLLSWVSSDQAKDFEQWVLRTVEDAPWDETCTSEPFQGLLTMLLPRVGRRWLQATRVWLETAPPDADRLPTTLWVEGLGMRAFGDHAFPMFVPLESVQEQSWEDCEDDGDSTVSEVLPCDSVSVRRSEASSSSGDAPAQVWPPAARPVEERLQHRSLEEQEEQLLESRLRTLMRSSLPPVIRFSL